MKCYLFAFDQKTRLHNFNKLGKSIDGLNANDIMNLEEKAYITRNKAIEDAIEELKIFGMAGYDEGDAREIYETLDNFPGKYQSDYVFYDLSNEKDLRNDLPVKGKWDLAVYNPKYSSHMAYRAWLCGLTRDIEYDN